MKPAPEHLWVWGGHRWRGSRLVRFARDGRRAVVRFFQPALRRWSGPRYVDLTDVRDDLGGG